MINIKNFKITSIPKGSSCLLPNGEFLNLKNYNHFTFKEKFKDNFNFSSIIDLNDGFFEPVVRVEIFNKPTYEQYDSLLEWFNYIINQNTDSFINIACHLNGCKNLNFKDYRIKKYEAKDFVNTIKRFYNTNSFLF